MGLMATMEHMPRKKRNTNKNAIIIYEVRERATWHQIRVIMAGFPSEITKLQFLPMICYTRVHTELGGKKKKH